MLNEAVIDLSAIRNNALTIKKQLNSGVKFCAVVKADAYGHGAQKVSNSLYPIVDCYAVALVEEGISLRMCGIDKEILVLIPVIKGDVEAAVRFNLTLTVCDGEDIKLIAEEGRRQRRVVKIHLKYNTGMNRFGVDDISSLEKVLRLIRKTPWVKLEGFYSHFACPENEEMRKAAENKFLLAFDVVKGYNKKVISHISASGGFLSGVQLDMVRIGIMLYGYTPFPTDKIKLKPAMKVYSYALKARKVSAGGGILYGSKILQNDTDATIVRFGYADGLMRKKCDGLLNNRGMDVSAVEGKSHGRVLIMDNASALAEKCGTISYEILCGIARRATKKYIGF